MLTFQQFTVVQGDVMWQFALGAVSLIIGLFVLCSMPMWGPELSDLITTSLYLLSWFFTIGGALFLLASVQTEVSLRA